MSKLIVGCGYLGFRVAQLWRSAGIEVLATTRSAERASSWSAWGLRPIVWDVTSGKLPLAAEVDTVVYAIGYDRASGRSKHEVYAEGLRNTLAGLSPATRRVILVSSVGVYSQHNGEWIDESSACEPTREGGQAALAAEECLFTSSFRERAIVLRAAGIYGPGRIPRSADLLAGRGLAVEADSFLNLIHVDDLAQIVVAAEQIQAPRTLLVSDGCPVLRREYYEYLAQLLGAPAVQFLPSAAGSRERERGGGNKRVCNARLREEIALELNYADFRTGLTSIVNAEREAAGGSNP